MFKVCCTQIPFYCAIFSSIQEGLPTYKIYKTKTLQKYNLSQSLYFEYKRARKTFDWKLISFPSKTKLFIYFLKLAIEL